jgi:hypothetical protein
MASLHAGNDSHHYTGGLCKGKMRQPARQGNRIKRMRHFPTSFGRIQASSSARKGERW